ncbi:MAG: hypothetical protein ABID04_02670 [Patescibacteria group bacterium]
MTRKRLVLFFLILFLFSLSRVAVLAQGEIDCPNRYLTLINPVRGRNLWLDQSLRPLEDQYGLIASYGFSATWLLQYDALTDEELVGFVKNQFSSNQELGLFLEVSPDLAESARVVYPPLLPWYDPQAVFLSGYSQSQRRKLIDTVFEKYKKTFGDYPASVGAWWLDSYSLEYLKSKYDIKAVLIVADQKTTDNYGVWGQWWGVPYYSSEANVLIPAQEKDKRGLVVLQWAQRDISKACGEGPSSSNYSLQANDYTERGLDTAYFKKLIASYLDCDLPVGQITVGLETGIESVKSFAEYENQLEALSGIEVVENVTMSQFSDYYQDIYQTNPERLVLKDDQSQWVLTPQERVNEYLKEKIAYRPDLAFADYFVADKSSFLDRKLPINQSEKQNFTGQFLILLAFVLGFVIYRRFALTKNYWSVSLFILACFLTTLLSYPKFAWQVYFGPVVGNIPVTQFLLVLISCCLFIPVLKIFTKKIKNVKLLILSLSLSFAADFVVSLLRYTQLGNDRYFGIAYDALRFIGLRVSPSSLAVVNQDFSSLVAGTLLKFDFGLIWASRLVAFVVYPLAHFVLGMLIYWFLSKLPKRLRQIVLVMLFILFCFYLYQTINLDPRVVLPWGY